tara:strand:+ start:3069 stop:3434 length:366 start_codon:yes stop_codon:yes gene_type:complete
MHKHTKHSKYYSISKKLKKENKITEEFEIIIDNLSLEDIIALKLELSAKLFKGKLYGFSLYKAIVDIAKDAVLKFAISATNSKRMAAFMLGISYRQLKYLQKKKNLENYFNYGDETVSTER